MNQVSQSVEYWLSSRRYHDEWNFAEKTDLGFNKAWIYNASGNSGLLNLVNTEKNNRYQNSQYPRVNNGQIEILQTPYDKKFTFNDFYNRVRDELSNTPVWTVDINNIEKTINSNAIDLRTKKFDRIRGDWSLTRLSQDVESRFKMIFKFMFNKNNLYL